MPKISVKLDAETHMWIKLKASMAGTNLMAYVRCLIERDIEALSLRDLQKKYARRESKDATR